MNNLLTPKQKQVLQAIKAFLAQSGRTPSVRELRDELAHRGLSVKSPRSIYLYLNSLEDAGYITRTARGRIEIPTETSGSFIDIPIFGTANAGQATLIAEQNLDGYLKLSKGLVPDGNIFAIKVSGDSMNLADVRGSNIDDGDYVLISSQTNFRDGDRVLAIIDGLATIKLFKKIKSDLIALLPESSNGKHHPIYLTPADDFVINGKVVGVLKS